MATIYNTSLQFYYLRFTFSIDLWLQMQYSFLSILNTHQSSNWLDCITIWLFFVIPFCCFFKFIVHYLTVTITICLVPFTFYIFYYLIFISLYTLYWGLNLFSLILLFSWFIFLFMGYLFTVASGYRNYW